MEPASLGLILDSSVLIAAERRGLAPVDVIANIRDAVGTMAIGLSAVTVAEISHGIYRASNLDVRRRRQSFLDELVAALPVYPYSRETAEIVGRISGEQAREGLRLPLADLMIGACALERGYAVATGNLRDFGRILDLRVIVI